MNGPEQLIWRESIVLASALIYWGGVMVQARRVRKKIGRSANLRPRGAKERLLWAGWTAVVVAWLILPLVAGRAGVDWLPGSQPLWQEVGFGLGLGLVLAGYGGTLWCYAALGSAWRIGVNRKEKNTLITCGPYRVVRHPIYLFQMVMLLGAAVLLPTWLALAILGFHFVCAWIKARDEELYLLESHGPSYADYCGQTGRFFPRRLRQGNG